ncbi:MAG: methyltransferase domain-containing protein [Planctomycetales bacterium]
MDWLHPLRSAFDRPALHPGIPWRLLKHLLDGAQMQPGCRVLDVGCGSGELLRFLRGLGLPGTGFDESLGDVCASRRISPDIPCHCGSLQVPLPVPGQHFHLVLARDLAAHDGDLLGAEALCVTARLIAATAPGGSVCLIHRVPSLDTVQGEQREDHHDECYRKHLEAFAPGACVVHIGDTWTWEDRFARKSRFLAASLPVPHEPRRPSEWLQIALVAARKRAAECCPRGSQHRIPAPRRAAA